MLPCIRKMPSSCVNTGLLPSRGCRSTHKANSMAQLVRSRKHSSQTEAQESRTRSRWCTSKLIIGSEKGLSRSFRWSCHAAAPKKNPDATISPELKWTMASTILCKCSRMITSPHYSRPPLAKAAIATHLRSCAQRAVLVSLERGLTLSAKKAAWSLAISSKIARRRVLLSSLL